MASSYTSIPRAMRESYRLFSQPDLARTIGKNGYETVVNKFSFESLINKHILLYSDLIL